MKIRNTLAIIVLAIGLTQMAGYLTGWKILRGIGLASGIAPFPKVFSEADGYEPFAATFRLLGEMPDGSPWPAPSPPHATRDSPAPTTAATSTAQHSPSPPASPPSSAIPSSALDLAPGSQLRKELQIPSEIKNLRVEITPRDGEPHGPWTFPAS